MPSIAEKRRTFRKLHEAGCFVIPNPWSIGTAKYLQHLGFKALASTSAGFAHFDGRPTAPSRATSMLAHLAELAAATDLPVNADFEAGYADDPGGVAESVRLCVETGVAGLSIEDSTGNAEKPLYDLDDALARLRAARAEIDRSGGDVLLTGRAECFLVRHPDALNELIRRLVAYSAAGADCLYAPGLRTREQIAAVVQAVAPKPVNLLVGFASELTVGDISELGVRRISVGSALARTAWIAFAKTAGEIAEKGRFDGFTGIATSGDLNKLFSEDRESLSSRNPMPSQPIGSPVDATAARRPQAVALEGRFGRIERLDARRHVGDLWSAFKSHDQLWTYMSYGPFADETAFGEWLADREKLEDPFYYAIVDTVAPGCRCRDADGNSSGDACH